MQPIIDSLPWEWEIVIWDNSYGYVKRQPERGGRDWNTWISTGRGNPPVDLSVYGRYAAIEYASHDLIYVADDDVIVSDPQAIMDEWCNVYGAKSFGDVTAQIQFNGVVCNMPQEFRHDFYREHALVGFGAAFHRDAPTRAFYQFEEEVVDAWDEWGKTDTETFHRCCDVVFTALTPRVLVDVPKQNLPWATDADRMYRERDHVDERTKMLELALKVRDA